MLKAVLFDLDGTIGDSLPLCVEAFRRAIEPLAGIHLSDQDIVDLFGPNEEGLVNTLVPDHFEEGMQGYLHHYRELHRERCPAPFDGMIDLLELLKQHGICMAIVTGKGKESAAIMLEQYGIAHYFSAMENGSPTGIRKADGMRAILEQFHLQPDQALYVGDSPSDIVHSKKAGIPAVAACWASTTDKAALLRENPDYIFDRVEEFHAFLTRQLTAGSPS